MQEDIAGVQAAGAGRSYATCSECGSVFVQRNARIAPTGLNDDTHSEFTELCPECEKLDRQGETPVLPRSEAG
jgi:hypothetical protein